MVWIVLGNVWSVLDPWRAVADAVAWCARKAGWSREARPYPAELGLWPAVLLLFSFVALELVYADQSEPRMLAIAIGVYSVATWTGMALFGREAWRDNGNGWPCTSAHLTRRPLRQPS